MKQRFLFFTCLLLLVNLASFAQQADLSPSVDTAAPVITKVKKPAKNFLKVNLLNLAIRNYSFQYERALSKRFSAAIGFRIMPKGGIPLLSTIEKSVSIDDEDVSETLRKVRIKNMAITPEVRFYVGKKGYGRGFYLAPFYRYAVYETGRLPVEINDEGKTVDLSGKLTTNTFGLQLGAQWMLSRRIFLDWWIIGPQFGTHKSEFTGSQDTNFTDDEKQDIDAFFEDFSLPNLNLTSKTNNNSITVSTSGPWAGIRAGLCLGVRF